MKPCPLCGNPAKALPPNAVGCPYCGFKCLDYQWDLLPRRMSKKDADELIEDAFHVVSMTSSGFAVEGARQAAYADLLKALTGESA